MDNRVLREHGAGILPLKTFRVQGWKLVSPASNNKQREPMEVRTIQATDPRQACVVYASCYQMPRKFWDDGTKQPLIVIRVEDGRPRGKKQ